MPKFVTPARLAAAVGVLTGLAAAATSLAGALPIGHTQEAIVGAAGLLTTGATLFTFLEGQSSWETAKLHVDSFAAADPDCAPGSDFKMGSEPEGAELIDEEAISDEPEPPRLVAMHEAWLKAHAEAPGEVKS